MKASKAVTYSIGDLAKEFDITTRSIRFYEDQGLISPVRKGQTRIYNQRDKVRLKLILRGKRLGFSLAETGRLFELYDADRTTATQLETMKILVAEKKAELNQQLEDIKIMLLELTNLEDSCQETLAATEQPTPSPTVNGPWITMQYNEVFTVGQTSLRIKVRFFSDVQAVVRVRTFLRRDDNTNIDNDQQPYGTGTGEIDVLFEFDADTFVEGKTYKVMTSLILLLFVVCRISL